MPRPLAGATPQKSNPTTAHAAQAHATTTVTAASAGSTGACTLTRGSTNVDSLPAAMNTQPHPLDFAARQAAKNAERQAITRELRAGVKTPAQIALDHQPFAALKRERTTVRLDLAKRLS